MMTTIAGARGRSEAAAATPLELEILERLACGCIVAVQRVRSSGAAVISLEAKGPHCTFSAHRANRVVRLDAPGDWPSYAEEGGVPF